MTFTEFDIEELRKVMLLELYDRKKQLKQCLNELDRNSENEEAYNSLIRTLHSLKGLFGMTGFSRISYMFKNMQCFISKNGNSDLNRIIPIMYQLYNELKTTYRELSQKRELNIKGIDKVNQQITFLFI